MLQGFILRKNLSRLGVILSNISLALLGIGITFVLSGLFSFLIIGMFALVILFMFMLILVTVGMIFIIIPNYWDLIGQYASWVGSLTDTGEFFSSLTGVGLWMLLAGVICSLLSALFLLFEPKPNNNGWRLVVPVVIIFVAIAVVVGFVISMNQGG